ncbi:EF hand [Planctomycetes bacterium MalM25]|nr:EF hand [Planctomycetes bacterium MalM25]
MIVLCLPRHRVIHSDPVLGSVLVLLAAVGCGSGPAAPRLPSVDANSAASDAMRLYDRNGDGTLDADERVASPALAKAARSIDSDGNGSIDQREICAYIESWKESGTALVDVIAEVVLDGAPLTDAELIVEPEPFLGDAYSIARSSTDASGLATFVGAHPQLPGLPVGFYRVRVSKKDAAGRERIPASYNDATELGIVVAANAGNHSRFELKSTR